MRLQYLLKASFCVSALSSNHRFQAKHALLERNNPIGDLKSINLEHLFDDLFRLKKKFEALGLVIKDNRV